MSARLTIAVDAMGGDNAPDAVIDGMAMALEDLPGNTKFLIYGDERRIRPLLSKNTRLKTVSTIHHTKELISNDDKPTAIIRSGKQSSMALAIDAVANGDADCIISAGNTGALMVLARMKLKTLPGIDRPAIAAPLPTETGVCVMLDLGANIECSPKNLVQFAVLGCLFSCSVFGVHSPKVGIINVGEEAQKGNQTVKKAAAILSDMALPGRFKGFVEGNDIPSGMVDVAVTDGFTGNIMLKTIEGTAKFIKNKMREAAHHSIFSKIGFLMARRSLLKMKDAIDPRRHNGAMFLGLGGVCVKSHGGTDALGFSNAVLVASELVINRFNERVADALKTIPDLNGDVNEKASS